MHAAKKIKSPENAKPANAKPAVRMLEERNSDYWKERLIGRGEDGIAAALKEAAIPGNMAAVGALYQLVLRDDTPMHLLEAAAETMAAIVSTPVEDAVRFFMKNLGSREGARAALYIARLIEKVDCGDVADGLIEALKRFAPEGNGHSAVEHLLEARQLAYALLNQLERKKDPRAAEVESIIRGFQHYDDPRDEEYGRAAQELIKVLENKA